VAISNKLAIREALRLGDINRRGFDDALDGITLTSPRGSRASECRAAAADDGLFELPPDGTVDEVVNTLAGRTKDPQRFNARMAEIVGDPDF